jgi:hypothetical protein
MRHACLVFFDGDKVVVQLSQDLTEDGLSAVASAVLEAVGDVPRYQANILEEREVPAPLVLGGCSD